MKKGETRATVMVAELWLLSVWRPLGVNGRTGGDVGTNPGTSGHASSGSDQNVTCSTGWDTATAGAQESARGNAGTSRGGADAHILGKPDAFHGEEAICRDWSTVMRACSGLCDPQLAVIVRAPDVVACEADILSIASNPSVEDVSSSLYCVLVFFFFDKTTSHGTLW